MLFLKSSVLINITILFCYFNQSNAITKINKENSTLVQLSDIKDNITDSPCLKIEFETNIFKFLSETILRQWKRRRRFESVQKQVFFSRDKKEPFDINFVNVKSHDYDSKASISPVVDTYSTSGSDITKFKLQWPLDLWRRYFFTDDYITLINPHWVKFSPPKPVVNYILGGLYIIIGAVGCSGNAIVLLMYLRCRSLRTPGNILVANLALSDFTMLAKTPIFTFNSFNQGPALGEIGCVIYGFIGGLTGCTSIATLAGIALDRYWAVVRPLEPLRALTAVRARLLAVGAWIYAAVFATIPALDIGYGRYVPEGYLTSCSFDYLTDEIKPKYFIFVFFCAAWVAPFCTISFCYVNILRVVVCKRNVSMIDHRLSSRHVKEQVKRKAEIKLAALVIAVIALFFISWTPYAVVALLGVFGRKDLITPIASIIPALFCKTAACINPFIYIITHPKFRIEFKKLLFRKKKARTSTMKTTYQKAYKDSSDTDVEVVEMKDIPFHNDKNKKRLKTVSSKVSERDDTNSISLKSFDEEAIPPPSWFAKPQFSKKRSFHRRSSMSIVSYNTDPTFI